MMASAFTGSVERCRLQMEQYLNIKQLSTQIGLSVRTIRAWITDPERPLPCFKLKGRLIFNGKEMAMWLEQFRVVTVNVDELVDDVLNDFGKDE